MRMGKQAAIRQAIKLALLASICFLVSIHSISMANPLIKIDKGTKTHQYHVTHKPSSKVKSKRSSNTHSYPNHTDHPHHPHTQIPVQDPNKLGLNKEQSQNISQRHNA